MSSLWGERGVLHSLAVELHLSAKPDVWRVSPHAAGIWTHTSAAMVAAWAGNTR